jgi:hypothetical protein
MHRVDSLLPLWQNPGDALSTCHSGLIRELAGRAPSLTYKFRIAPDRNTILVEVVSALPYVRCRQPQLYPDIDVYLLLLAHRKHSR